MRSPPMLLRPLSVRCFSRSVPIRAPISRAVAKSLTTPRSTAGSMRGIVAGIGDPGSRIDRHRRDAPSFCLLSSVFCLLSSVYFFNNSDPENVPTQVFTV